MDPSATIVSPAFRLDRKRFARVATLFFIRRYWLVYFLAVVIGIALIATQQSGMGFWVGIVFAVYPFTVPIRYSMVVTAKASSFLDQETTYEVDKEAIWIRNEAGGTTRAQLSAVRSYEVIAETLVMLFGKAAFLMVPIDVLQDEERNVFLQRVRSRGL